ncbi:MAG: 2-dehydropantoate 2-reductase [Xylophilus ampelinus]
MTKVCIYGAGAIGGLIGARLALRGDCAVSAVARGATLASLRAHGWRVRHQGVARQAPCAGAAEDPAGLGVQDIVVVAVKGPAMAAVAAGIGPLLGPDTVVVPAMNGVPWWFGQGVEALERSPLETVDPGGRISARIDLRRVVGCVVHASASMPEPGLVDHHMGHGLILGEPRGGISPRAEAITALLAGAGFEATASADIRRDIWYKLWGNLTVNPVSAITGATVDRILDDALVRDFCSRVMEEAAAVGARIGCGIAQSPEDRHRITRKLGGFRSSMLQDVEAGRAIELDAIVGAVHEMAGRLGVPVPHTAALLGLARLFGRTHRLYPQA